MEVCHLVRELQWSWLRRTDRRASTSVLIGWDAPGLRPSLGLKLNISVAWGTCGQQEGLCKEPGRSRPAPAPRWRLGRPGLQSGLTAIWTGASRPQSRLHRPYRAPPPIITSPRRTQHVLWRGPAATHLSLAQLILAAAAIQVGPGGPMAIGQRACKRGRPHDAASAWEHPRPPLPRPRRRPPIAHPNRASTGTRQELRCWRGEPLPEPTLAATPAPPRPPSCGQPSHPADARPLSQPLRHGRRAPWCGSG